MSNLHLVPDTPAPRRQTVAIGHWKGEEKTKRLAVRCAWCKRWRSVEDERAAERGALISDGMCDDCAETWGDDGSDGEAA